MSTIQIDKLLQTVVNNKASDLHITTGQPPVIRSGGRMLKLETKTLEADDTVSLMKSITPERNQQELQEKGGTDFGFAFGEQARFRVAVFKQRGHVGLVLRRIPNEFLSFEVLGLPPVIADLITRPRGLFLVTGPTGSGKTTSLASMINHINDTEDRHIITLEDPIEYLFSNERCVIEQREVGSDVPEFASGLRHALRQDPDIILVGEMRDLETISAALTAAETGHLVLASLHTINAVDTVNRIVDVFPPGQQAQVRVQLAETLQGVVCQTLFHDELDGGMAPASEIMVVTPAMRRAIRDGETHLLQGMIETGRSMGMQTMDYSIAELVKAKRVSPAFALSRAHNPEKLGKLIAA